MPEKKDRADATARGSARRRSRFAAGRDGGRVSRPLLLAMIVILAGGAYLFWPRGGGAPTGIGEQLTVVTADSSLAAAPRSGSVEIQDQVQEIVPEQPSGGARDEAREPEPAAEPDAPAEKPATTRPATREATSPPPAAAEEKPRIAPRPTGSWAVQVGAFQTEENAAKVVTDLAAKGVTAHVRAAGTSSGDIVYRVWIGWFSSRQEAVDYSKQERRTIGESYPVHR
jgi:cell division septation protein DedD